MRTIQDICMFFAGLAIALITASLARFGVGVWPMVQLPLIALALAVFYLNERHLASLAAGLGLGLDALSAYPFLTWTCIIGGTTLVGWWLSKAIFTNRSLPSLLLLGAAMRLAYFLLELGFSRVGSLFGGTVWYLPGSINALRGFSSIGIEMAVLVVVFGVHIRLRGDRARMLTHL
jgi:hypothetical protein